MLKHTPADHQDHELLLAAQKEVHELALKISSSDRRPPPEFLFPLPIRKTRAGLQFTCASSSLGSNQYGFRDVWVCNSDGYVGQVRRALFVLRRRANVVIHFWSGPHYVMPRCAFYRYNPSRP